ncbi:MAG: tRNA (adenosine(37)-N6)-dimethylallyltransferase MiaA [Gammaproteobacteria bacterium AqS3]|nr:tRNA (adenosine(37)-N6)-dimethylallyltransferase MiaA [Gammaproteobacteria bacterium AqS3]
MDKPIYALVGPTGIGKTGWVLRAGERHPCAVISVDSVQVYRGMDIGTAKPAASERSVVPHSLIDVCAPDVAYSAADFCRDACTALEAIRSEGVRTPLLVGGSMFYLRALLSGLASTGGAAPEIRSTIRREAAERGWAALHAELAREDPEAAARIAPADGIRIGRALEVLRATGEPLSRHQRRGRTSPWTHPVEVVALMPDSRADLHRALGERVKSMLAAGLIDEIRALMDQYGFDPSLPAWRAVAYRQGAQYLRCGGTLDQLADSIAAASRQLAKRQMTWIRQWPGIRVIQSARDENNYMRSSSHPLDFIFE